MKVGVFSQAHHVDDVDVQPDRSRDGTDEDPFAEVTYPRPSRLQILQQQFCQTRQISLGLDELESRHAAKRLLDDDGGVLLVGRNVALIGWFAVQIMEELQRPGRECRPGVLSQTVLRPGLKTHHE